MSKCRIKINLDVANFLPNKSATQIWVVTHHPYEFWARSLDVMSGRRGGEARENESFSLGRSQSWRREMSPFLFLKRKATSFGEF